MTSRRTRETPSREFARVVTNSQGRWFALHEREPAPAAMTSLSALHGVVFASLSVVATSIDARRAAQARALLAAPPINNKTLDRAPTRVGGQRDLSEGLTDTSANTTRDNRLTIQGSELLTRVQNSSQKSTAPRQGGYPLKFRPLC